MDGVNDYICTCVVGYTGKNCSLGKKILSAEKLQTVRNSIIIQIFNLKNHLVQEIDDCAQRPCQNEATCMDSVDDYSCTCVAGYSGKNCSLGNNSLVNWNN